MGRRGFKACQHCDVEIAAASKTCSACGHQQPSKQKITITGAGISPVQTRRFELLKNVHVKSPDAESCRPTSKRNLGLSSRYVAGRTLATVGSDHEPDDGDPGTYESMHRSRDHPPQLAHLQPQLTPVSRVPLRLHGETSLQQCIRALQLTEHRCVLVAENSRGASCYAVAGYDLGAMGDLSILVSRASQAIWCSLFSVWTCYETIARDFWSTKEH